MMKLDRKKIERILHAERIAAGEVIERPSNIVKELVENSIDAGAREIKILVKNAGKTYIQVIDDGIGIPAEEMEIAFLRHTSSKIRSFEDLNNLHTLGFRGEALASIAVVSKVAILSRIEDNDLGLQLVLEGGKVVEKKSVSCPVGTNIKILNLFYNIPVRKKFLKSNPTELGHITDILQRYALAYPELHFYYAHDELDILNCPHSNDLKTTVFHIYGKDIATRMVNIEYSEKGEGIKVGGLLGHPSIAKKNRKDSSIFLNHRYITSDLLFRAINEAYKGTLMINKHPFFILFIEIDPSHVDFNVHPKKLHVRFEDETFIYNKLYNIIRKFVEQNFRKEEKAYISTQLHDYTESKLKDSSQEPCPEETTLKEREVMTDSNSLSLEKERDINEIPSEAVQTSLIERNFIKETKGKIKMESLIRDKYIVEKNFPRIKLIPSTGQLSNKIYVLLEGYDQEGEGGLFILDQHAASERINKEKFMKMFESTTKQKQVLISPLKIEVSPSEKFYLMENLDKFNQLGFSFEHFGGNTFILREIPVIVGKSVNTEIIKELISDIAEIGKERAFTQVKEEIINYLSCHKSIRGGDDLSLQDIRNLLIQLSSCEDPFHCAHGRPVLKFFSFKELDKLFKRTG